MENNYLNNVGICKIKYKIKKVQQKIYIFQKIKALKKSGFVQQFELIFTTNALICILS